MAELEDLKDIRADAAKMVNRHEGYDSIVKLIDHIETNKAFLKLSEAKKREREANEEKIERLHGEVAELTAVLGGLRDKKVELDEYIEGEGRKKMRDQDKEIRLLGSKRTAEIYKALESERQDLEDVRAEAKKMKADLAGALTGLRDLRTTINLILNV